ncbi:MAG: hypothetical protein K2O32_04445 [Acetatifactor sp.]|nr:hypothetical protein [Acetatifactor sp.]
MDFGLTGKVGGYYLAEQYRKNVATGKSDGVGFAELAAAKMARQESVSGMSFKDMWQARYPGAYYHVMDGSAISQGAWDRNDFPLEKFFQDDTDASVLNWKPTGAEPEATSSQVQSRWNSTLGQKSIIVPPELEEKMKNDPELAKRVMANVENFITTYTATSVRPGRICSWLISLDENGEIEKYRVTGGGGNISGPTEEQQRQFEAEQAAKKKRREEYARLNEESALKRKLMEQEADERYYKSSITKKVVSAAAYTYEQNIMEAAGIVE